MEPRISLKKFDIDYPYANAYTVTVSGVPGEGTFEVYTNRQGHGLWVDGKQVLGTSQFNAGKNPANAIRNYFKRN